MKHTVFTLLLVVSLTAYGQDTLQIGKQEFIERVVQNSYKKRVSDKEAEMARADYRQSNSLFMPSVSASYSAITTNNPLMAFGSRLNQEILTQNDFNPALLNDPESIENFALEIQVQQPLLNLDGLYGRKAAKIQQEAYELKAGRTREYLEFEASRLYMQLQLTYQTVSVLRRARKTAEEAVRMVTDYFDQGMVQRADVLDAQVRSNEVNSQLQYAESEVRNTSDMLLVLMGEEMTSALLKPDEEFSSEFSAMEIGEAFPSRRKDLIAMEKSVEGYRNMHRSARMKFIPRVNAFGSYQMFDGQFMEFDASGYILGAQLSWDIFKGYSQVAQSDKARLEWEKARIEQQEYEARQLSELNKTRRMLEVTRNKIDMMELAFEQARESYKIRKDRFEQGLEKTVDLLASESRLYQKELQLNQAVFEYNFTQEYLEFLTRE